MYFSVCTKSCAPSQIEVIFFPYKCENLHTNVKIKKMYIDIICKICFTNLVLNLFQKRFSKSGWKWHSVILLFETAVVFTCLSTILPMNKAFRHVQTLFVQGVCFYSSRPGIISFYSSRLALFRQPIAGLNE